MQRPNNFENALSVTSQFYFCALPLRLDTYSKCQFRCTYCFAHARGGNIDRSEIKSADPSSLARRLGRVAEGSISGAIDEMLSRRQPIHLGGMSDPFPPMERLFRITYEHLKILRDFDYPTVISTKSADVAHSKNLDVLATGRFIVQFSLSSTNDALMRKIDAGAPGPKELLRTMRALASAGVKTTCRIQPLLPTLEEGASDLIHACAEAGVKHIAVEHLKLPLEKNYASTHKLSSALGLDVQSYFRKHKAMRLGREWVLPVEDRLEKMLHLRSVAHKAGLSFGAADTDLLPFSDGNCCCSGADLTWEGAHFNKHTYNHAARVGIKNGVVKFSLIADEWSPQSTIARYVNSRSRLPGGATITDYVRRNWNGRSNGASPQMFWGIAFEGEVDQAGYNFYVPSNSLQRLSQR